MDNYTNILKGLARWELFVYDNDKQFLKEFVLDPDAWQIAAVRFSEEWVDFTYVDWSGAHIVDSIRMEQFLNWFHRGPEWQNTTISQT